MTIFFFSIFHFKMCQVDCRDLFYPKQCVACMCISSLIENVWGVLKVKEICEFEASARAHVIVLSDFFSKMCVWALTLTTCLMMETQSYKQIWTTENIHFISHDFVGFRER